MLPLKKCHFTLQNLTLGLRNFFSVKILRQIRCRHHCSVLCTGTLFIRKKSTPFLPNNMLILKSGTKFKHIEMNTMGYIVHRFMLNFICMIFSLRSLNQKILYREGVCNNYLPFKLTTWYSKLPPTKIWGKI